MNKYLKSTNTITKTIKAKSRLVKGFTLLEIILVLGLMIIISVISVKSFFTLREKHSIQKDADSIVSIIEKTKNLSSNRKNDSAYGIKFSSSSVIAYSGSSYETGNKISEYNLEKTVTISNISLYTSSGIIQTEIDFAKITGNPNATGTIMLSSPSYSRIVTIYGTGIIEVK